MTRSMLVGVLVGVFTLSMIVRAYQNPPPSGPTPQALEATKIEKVKDNLYMITGSTSTPREAFSGGNTAVFITAAGVTVVDTKLTGWGQVILDRIKTVTDKPVTTIINTHTHGDHTGSNNMFPATVEIVAHENTKANMEKMDAFKGEGAKGLPKRTYKDTLSLGSGKDRIDLYYFGRAHTDGDAWVVFPELRVMHTGDIFAAKDAPFVDRTNGGSNMEYSQTLGKALSTVKNVDTLIVGHSPLRTIPELRQYQSFMNEFVAAVQGAHEAGKTVDEAAASIDLTKKYPGYSKDQYKRGVQSIYDEIEKK